MKYSQVLQTSRIFPCTEKNREEVLEKVKNELSKIKTELAMQHLFEKTETALYGTLLIKSHGEPDRIFGFGNSKIWREAAGIVLFRILFETGIPQKADMAAKRFPRFLTSMIVTFSWTSSTAIEKHLLFGARWKIDFTGENRKTGDQTGAQL